MFYVNYNPTGPGTLQSNPVSDVLIYGFSWSTVRCLKDGPQVVQPLLIDYLSTLSLSMTTTRFCMPLSISWGQSSSSTFSVQISSRPARGTTHALTLGERDEGDRVQPLKGANCLLPSPGKLSEATVPIDSSPENSHKQQS